MAVTFATNASHLAAWGFSIGDIAAISGAGRGIITWLTADPRDNNLLDFLNVTEKELKFRGGLVDPIALNERWSRRITLFRNGRRIEQQRPGDSPQLENFCRFTWMMTIIVAGLDTSVSNVLLESIVVEFTSQLFHDSILDMEYLQHEIPQHINGWRSAAATRNMAPRARQIWDGLESQAKHHLPGFIPANEKEDIVRFLIWLTIGKTPEMTTTSSDVYSLATLLSEIGFDSLRLFDTPDSRRAALDESVCALIYQEEHISDNAYQTRTSAEGRKGMRIPLAAMYDTVSLWPQPLEPHNKLRLIFSNAQKAAAEVCVEACPSPFGYGDLDPGMHVTSRVTAETQRLHPDVFRLVNTFLLLDSPETCEALQDLVSSWSEQGLEYVTSFLTIRQLMKPSAAQSGPSARPQQVWLPIADADVSRERCMVQLRTFLLGYYYGTLIQILDVSNLQTKECFGSWSWNDMNFFKMIMELVKSQIDGQTTGKMYWRYQIMKMVAYLFAGAEDDQLSLLKHGSAGIVAKLSVLTPGLLGEADTPRKISKLHLLDVDPTVIPSNQRGIVLCGGEEHCKVHERHSRESLPYDASFKNWNSDPDFTSHLEPAWGYDTNLSLVAYRYKGRLIHKVNPLQAEAAVLEWWAGSQHTTDEATVVRSISAVDLGRTPAQSEDEEAAPEVSYVFVASPSDFEGGHIQVTDNVALTGQHARVIFVASTAKPKARTCIAAMYQSQCVDKKWELFAFDWSGISAMAIVMQSASDRLVVLL